MSESLKVAGQPGVDPTLARVEIKLGGDSYFLCFTFTALAIAENRLRKVGVQANLLHCLDLGSVDATKLVPLLYASLITHQPEIAFDEVTSLVTLDNLATIFDGIALAYGESLAKPKDDEAESSEDDEADPTRPE